MKSPQRHTIQSSDVKYNYLLFDSVVAFNAFVDNQVKQLSVANTSQWDWIQQITKDKLKSRTDWYGKPTPKDISELEAHYWFIGMSLVKKIQPKIKDKLAPFLEHLNEAVLPKPKMTYNDRGLGVFSFDRAAMGLYRQFTVDTQTPISTSISQMHIELGNKQAQTSVKSVYAYFQNKMQSYPSLQLYIMAGANAQVKGDDLLYVGLACAELVAFMELRGISVEVNVLLGTSFNDQITMSCVRVKRYQDQLDKNQLLLLSSDPRYFRYRGFKALIAMTNYFGLSIPAGLGTISASMGTAFVNTIAPKGFVFEQSYSMDSAVKEVLRISTNYKKQQHGRS